VRDLQKADKLWWRAKGMDRSCPVGPRVVGGLDPSDLAITTRVNGETRQRGRTSEMVFPVPALIAFISRYTTLMPGDVILTGTPAGVGNLTPGDVVEVEIEGIGVLSSPVVGDDGSTPGAAPGGATVGSGD
jgi:2-keto-4-pentenoate hydratase/2-oxohepta-3-ene-1,7-dioic acid hydratase in catechol pathway